MRLRKSPVFYSKFYIQTKCGRILYPNQVRPWCVDVVGGTVAGQAWKGPTGRATVYAVAHAHLDHHMTLYLVMDDGRHAGELWMVEHVFVRFCDNLTWGRTREKSRDSAGAESSGGSTPEAG